MSGQPQHPQSQQNDLPPEECLSEMKIKGNNSPTSAHHMLICGTDPIINCKDYSLLHRLLGVTAAVLKFVRIVMSRRMWIEVDVGIRHDEPKLDVWKAEQYWIIVSQCLSARMILQFGNTNLVYSLTMKEYGNVVAI